MHERLEALVLVAAKLAPLFEALVVDEVAHLVNGRELHVVGRRFVLVLFLLLTAMSAALRAPPLHSDVAGFRTRMCVRSVPGSLFDLERDLRQLAVPVHLRDEVYRLLKAWLFGAVTKLEGVVNGL